MSKKQTKKKASNGDKKTKRVPSKKKKTTTKRARGLTPWPRENRDDDVKKMAIARNERFEARQAKTEPNLKREPVIEDELAEDVEIENSEDMGGPEYEDVMDSEYSKHVDSCGVARRVKKPSGPHSVLLEKINFEKENSQIQKTSTASERLETSENNKIGRKTKSTSSENSNSLENENIADVGIQGSENSENVENAEKQKSSTASGRFETSKKRKFAVKMESSLRNGQEKEEDVTCDDPEPCHFRISLKKREIEDNADSEDVKMEADDETVKIEDVEDVDTSEVQPLESMNLLQLLELLHKILLTLDSPFLKEIAEKFQKSMGKTRNSRKIPMKTAILSLEVIVKLSTQRYSVEDVNQKTSISNHEILTLLKNTCLFLNSQMTSNLLNDIKIAKKNSEKKIPVRNVQIALETALLLINP